MKLTARKESLRTRQTKDRFERYIYVYYHTRHTFPTMRELQQALNIPSLSTVSRYVHKLIDEGKIEWPNAKQRPNLLTKQSLCVFSNSPQRKCIRTADGSVLYLDCQVIQGSTGNLDVQFSGVVDLSKCRQNVTQVVSSFNVEG